MSQSSLSFLSERFRLEMVNSTTFVSFTNESVSGIVTCKDKQPQFVFSGYQWETLDPGCVSSERGVTIPSAFDPKIEEKQVLSVFKGNVSLAANMTAMNSSLTETLTDLDKIDLNSLVKGRIAYFRHIRDGLDGSVRHSGVDKSPLPVQAKVVCPSNWGPSGG